MHILRNRIDTNQKLNYTMSKKLHGHLPLSISVYLEHLFSGHIVRILLFRISFAYITRRYTYRLTLAHSFTSAEWNET